MMTEQEVKPKDEQRVELASQFGYSVWITRRSMDTPLPKFHRYASSDRATCGTRVTGAMLIPTAHAARFAVPCTRCFPENE